MQWQPGQSGNPKGRKAERDLAAVRAAAKSHMRTAINTLVRVCKQGDKDSARVAAACALLDRGFGKPEAVDALRDATDESLRAEVIRRRELGRAPPVVEAGGDGGVAN